MASGGLKAAGRFRTVRRRDPKAALLSKGPVNGPSAWIHDGRARTDIVISAAKAADISPERLDRLQLEIVFCGNDARQAGDLFTEPLSAVMSLPGAAPVLQPTDRNVRCRVRDHDLRGQAALPHRQELRTPLLDQLLA